MLQLFEGAVIGSREGAFVADHEGEAGTGVGKVLEDPGEARGIGDVVVGIVDLLFALDQLQLEEGSLQGEDAVEAPARGGHGFDRVRFDEGGGLELIEISMEESFEFRFGFAGDDDGFGAEAVTQGVARGSGFAFGGDGAAGFGAVGSGGLGFVAHV